VRAVARSVIFAAQLRNEAIIQLLEQQLAARCEKLTECKTIKLPTLGDKSASREQIMQQLVLELVIRREQTYIDWLKQPLTSLAASKLFTRHLQGERGTRTREWWNHRLRQGRFLSANC